MYLGVYNESHKQIKLIVIIKKLTLNVKKWVAYEPDPCLYSFLPEA
jgi:hypothetical protein